MGVYFGTDGVRGVANKDLTPELAFKLGQAGAYTLTKHLHNEDRKAKILIGNDGRISADMLENALAAGMCSVGAHVSIVGIIPTPAIPFLVKKYGYDAGVMISASHNPAQYNGIKFFDSQGYKLPDALEDEIEAILLEEGGLDKLPRPTADGIGCVDEIEEALEDYTARLVSLSANKFDGLSVALDCANGASYKVAPLAFDELGAQTNVIANEPNGMNINDGCGSTHIEQLQKKVLEIGANVGFAFDGDADRCLAVDEKGNLVDGDQLMTVNANYMKQCGTLKDDTVVATVMSNLGFFIMGKEQGLHIEQTAVGDRYVLERMLEKGYNLGGEQSGHIIFLDDNTTGDGVLSAIRTLGVMKATGKPLSELASAMSVLPQALVNATVANEKKMDYTNDAAIQKAIADVEAKYAGDGRVLIRPSGTEPLVRVMIEGKNQAELQADAEMIAKLIEEKLQ